MMPEAALAVFSGVIVGAALGTTGGGGSLLAIPLLVYLLGVHVQPAAAMSLLVVALSALLGVYQRRGSGEVNVRAALVFSATGIASAWLGAYAHRLVREETALLLFGCVMIFAARQMWRQSGEREESAAIGECADEFPRSCWYKLSLIGVVVGLMTGFFGVGGGFVIVPTLVLVLKFPMRMAVSTSLLIMALVAIGGLVGHLRAGRIEWALTGWLLIGSLSGMTAGSWLEQRLPPTVLTKGVAAIAFGIALVIIGRTGGQWLGVIG